MRAVLLLIVAVLVACAAPAPTNRELEQIARDYQRQQAEEQAASGPPPSDPNDTCGMAENASLIGKREGEFSAPSNARVVCHNCPVTMDFSATRLNIELDQEGRVANLRCG